MYSTQWASRTASGIHLLTFTLRFTAHSWFSFLDCGGQYADGLMIGTTPGGFDVVDGGRATSLYTMLPDHIGAQHQPEHRHLPGNQSVLDLYLSYNASGGWKQTASSGLHVGQVGLTVEHQDTVYAAPPELSTKGLAWYSVQNKGLVLEQGNTMRLRFRLFCIKPGESRVLISIPMPHYDPVEFGFAKECDHATALRHERFFSLNVGTATLALVVLVTCAVSGAYIWTRRSSTSHSYKQVPTTDGQ